MKQTKTTSDDFQKIVRQELTKLNEKIDSVKHEIKKEQKDYHNENMNKHDETIKILETLRDENTIGVYQAGELKIDIEKLKKRVTKLEQTHQQS